MNASRSRREVTSETSMFDTDNGPSYVVLLSIASVLCQSRACFASPPCRGERIEVRGPKAHASCQSASSPSPSPLRRARRPICAQRVLILVGRANGKSIKAPVSISRHELLQRFSHFFLTDKQVDEK